MIWSKYKRVGENFATIVWFDRIIPKSESPESQDYENNHFIEYYSDISIDDDDIINQDIPNTYKGRNPKVCYNNVHSMDGIITDGILSFKFRYLTESEVPRSILQK